MSELRPDKLRECGIDPERVPAHIAIIMDGNGRWASHRGLPRLEGHRRGYKTVDRVVRLAGEFGIKALTLYTFSAENWRRPRSEISGIMKLIASAAHQELRKLMDEGVQLRLSGRTDDLPDFVRQALLDDVRRTQDNTGLILNLAINYGGRGELVDAFRQIALRVQRGELSPDDIDERTIAASLYQPGLPDPDLLIRTAGEMRISNFLLWQIAYAELHVTHVLWPDFGEEDLLKAIADYQSRVRKFGGVVNSPGQDLASAAAPDLSPAPSIS
ncbi:MAG: isoprenyl transferase [Armatimonadetes bacterium]|nr:isoprenyl transferase [Armatimonadota bacterium]